MIYSKIKKISFIVFPVSSEILCAISKLGLTLPFSILDKYGLDIPILSANFFCDILDSFLIYCKLFFILIPPNFIYNFFVNHSIRLFFTLVNYFLLNFYFC